MIRRLFTVASVASLLVCVTAAALWVRSYSRPMEFVSPGKRAFALPLGGFAPSLASPDGTIAPMLHRLPFAAASTVSLLLCACSLLVAADRGQTRAARPSRDTATEVEYEKLLTDIRKYNSTGTINGWVMNSEHLFLGYDEDWEPDSLLNRARRFSRENGALDLLFSKITNRATGPDETLAIAEILVYYGQHHEQGDEHVTSARASEVRKAIDAGRLTDAERDFPDAPIRKQILWAVEKASRNLANPDTQPTSAAAEPPYAPIGRVDGAAHGVHSPFARDSRAFVTAAGDAVRVWDAATLRPLTGPLPHPGLRLYRLAPAGDTLVTANGDEVRVWDVASGRLRSATRVSRRKLELVEFAPDGRRFVTIEHDRDDAGRLWRITDGSVESMSLAGDDGMDAAQFDPTGRWIVTHLWGDPFHVWSVETGREVCPPIRSTDGWFTPYRARFDPAGRRLVVPQRDGFTVVDLATWKTVCRCRLDHGDLTNRVVFNSAGTQVIVTTLHELVDGPVRVFDAESAKPLRTFGQQVNRCEVAAGGTAAICVPLLRTKADTPSLWDPATGRQIQQLPHIESPDVFFSPDGTTLLLETEPGVTSVWRLEPCRPTTRP